MRSAPWVRGIAVLAGIVASPALAAGETRTFDRVTFAAPDGWTVDESKADLVALSRVSRDSYCLVAIYASTPARGDLTQSFAAEWQAVALKTIAPVAAPAPTLHDVGNTRAAVGGAASTAQGRPAAAVLMVLDAGAQVMSVLILGPSGEALGACTGDLQAMLGGLVVRRADGAPPAAAPPADGKLVVPPLSRAVTLADLAGEWKNEDGVTTRYVYRDSGAYAGSDSIRTRDRWTITAKGELSTDFFAIRNGKKIVEQNSGVITLTGRVLDLKRRAGTPARYVIRGWLDAPTMTVIELNGPWYDGEIPARIFTDPAYGTNLNGLWVRSKPQPK